jgi:hypothetical protein
VKQGFCVTSVSINYLNGFGSHLLAIMQIN